MHWTNFTTGKVFSKISANAQEGARQILLLFLGVDNTKKHLWIFKMSAVYRRHEKEKKRVYDQRIHASFTPLVKSTELFTRD